MSDDLVKRIDARARQGIAGTPFNLLMDAKERIEALTAERDRYRKALEGLMVHEPDYSDTLWQDAREALNGETP